MVLYVWENSIGNINDPDDSSFASDASSSQTYLIWAVWVLNQFIIVIILLNFLIAVISQSYENVMSSKTIKQYQDIAALNKETFQFLNTMGLLAGNELVQKNRILITVEAENENESSEWTGFVSTMKSFIKKSLGNSTRQMQDFIKGRLGDMKTSITGIEESMNKEMSVVKSEIHEVKTSQESIKSDLASIKDVLQ